jgi:hypothetical protein
MPRYAKLVLILVALAAGGCESCDGCNANESWLEGASRGEPGSLEGDRGATSRGDAGAAGAGAGEPAERQPSARKALDDYGGSMNRLAAAIEAGIAAERGDSPCERALTGLYGMFDHIAAHAEEGEDVPRAPSSIVFVQVCDGLEIEAQRCMQLSYSREHQETCSRIYDELPQETQERIQKVTSGK